MATLSSRVQPIYDPSAARSVGAPRPARDEPITSPVRVVRQPRVHARKALTIAGALVLGFSVYLAGVTMQFQANYDRVQLNRRISVLENRNQELRVLRDARKQSSGAEQWALKQNMVLHAPPIVLRDAER